MNVFIFDSTLESLYLLQILLWKNTALGGIYNCRFTHAQSTLDFLGVMGNLGKVDAEAFPKKFCKSVNREPWN